MKNFKKLLGGWKLQEEEKEIWEFLRGLPVKKANIFSQEGTWLLTFYSPSKNNFGNNDRISVVVRSNEISKVFVHKNFERDRYSYSGREIAFRKKIATFVKKAEKEFNKRDHSNVYTYTGGVDTDPRVPLSSKEWGYLEKRLSK